MLKGLTSTFKDGCNNVELTYKEYVKLDNDIIPVKATLKDDVYENGNFIGTFILKEIQFETEATYEFRNKEFEYYKEVDGESIKIGTFISTDITINDTTEIVKVVGMDYGLKTQVEYTSSLDYSSGTITLMDVWNECCELSGLESGIDDFANSDFIVDSDQFTGTGAMIRDVFKGIAMSSGSFVKVMNDDKVYLIFNEITSEKEELEIDGSASVDDVLKIDELTELDGNTTQEGTPTPDSPQPVNVVSGRQEVSVVGKNLFDNSKPYTYQTINNYSETTIPTGKRITWISSSNFTYQFLVYAVMDLTNYVGKTIRFKTDFSASGNNIGSYYIGLCNADGSNRTSKASTKTSGATISFIVPTLSGEQKYLCVALYVNLTGTLAQNDYVDYTNIMLTIDDSNMTYEAFKGQSYEINLGKNLLDTIKTSVSTHGITFTPQSDGSIKLTGTSDGGFNVAIVNPSNPAIINDGTYTRTIKIDGTLTRNGANIIMTGRDSTISNNVLGDLNINKDVNGIETFTRTTTITGTHTMSYIQIYCGSAGAVFDCTIYPMLEKGSQATSYSPYKTPIELCKIGTYQDRIYKENGTWYLHKEIGKVVLNGSENWSARAFPDNSYLSVKMTLQPKENGGLCNYFISDNRYDIVNEHMTISKQWNELCFAILKSRLSTQDTAGFKTWLSTNQPIVYYVLKTPTTTEITDTELISQLNAIELLEGTNNISITSNDLTGKLKLTYYNNDLDIIEDYVELEDKRDTHPWTCLRLGMSNIDGENVDYIDEDLVEQYGENWLILNDNPFAYNQEKRQQLIMNIFNQIKAFGYSAFVSKVAFKPYLTSGDIIHFRNREKELVKSIVLRYTHSGEQITLEAPSETSATINYVYPLGAIDIAKQTQIIVDKDSVRIDSLTSQTQTIQDELRENYYTLEQTNQLVQTASTGLTNTFSEAGGNNIFRNTGLWFATSDSNNPYEFWNGVVVKQKEEKASNMSAMLLQNGNVSQEQLVPNGRYTISFKYNKPILLANAKVYINDTEYVLSATEDTEFIQVIEVSSQHINIRFNSDVNNGCEIYDLMVNAGEVKLAYSQNQNETTTDTVNISKGITITSSDIDVKFKADADGIRTLDNNNNEITKFTDTGMRTKEATIESKSQIVGTLWQEVGEQTWITRL